MRYSILKNDEYIPFIRIWKTQTGKYTYDELLETIKTFDMDNKIVYKVSNSFREVSYEDFLDFKYCGYLFVDKKERSNMEKWLEFIKVNNINLRYLNNPLPKFYEINVIEFEKLKKKINNEI